MRSSYRLAGVALILAGTVAGHAAAYLIAGGRSHGGLHGYLDLIWGPVGMAALAALAWFARTGARSPLRVGFIAAAQLALFLLQETLEAFLGGHGLDATLASPAIRYGVAVQLVFAPGVVLLARLAVLGGARLRAALSRGRAWRPTRPTPALPVAASRHTGPPPVAPGSERGPPELLAAT